VTARAPRGDEGELFAHYHDMLLRAVSRQASAPAVVIEDACAFAWLQLLRYQPQRDNIVGWLVTVAVREAWKLSRRQRAEISGEVEASDAYAHLEHIGATLDDQVAAREALRAVAELPERQRHLLARQAAGLSHDELAADTGDSMRTIDRQLGRARARIREAGGET
jgi:RNA polymerase sigma factor (sigma-70 family)